MMGPGGKAIDRLSSGSGSGPLSEEFVATHLAPLFSRVLASERIYLANHSLGRPLDCMADDVAEGLGLWYRELGEAWEGWLAERESFRERIAQLLHAPRVDCVVPKTAAGQGLRTVLNALPGKPRVLTTRGEFDSVDLILKQYASLGRIELRQVEADAAGEFDVERMTAALESGTDLVVISQVMYATGQLLHGLERLAAACHASGARLLVDAYHAVGVVPVDVISTQADFLIGGSYKYLHGGPGAGFLYLSPGVLESGLRPLDTGWFAKAEMFQFARTEQPVLRPGGDAYLEGTPPVLTWYQARSGQEFVLGIGVERLRAYSLQQLRALKGYLRAAGVGNVTGGDENHGAFLVVRHPRAAELVKALAQRGVDADARGASLRLCPDCLTRDAELRRAAEVLGELVA